MAIQNIFYGLGVLFIFLAIAYFVKEYIPEIPNEIKLILLISSVVVAFIIAEFLRMWDK